MSSERARRGALDPRLLRHARAARTFIGVSIALGVTNALLVVAQAWLLAEIIAGAVVAGRDAAQLKSAITLLLAVVLARGATAWASDVAAGRASARAKSQLRTALVRRIAELGPGGQGERRSGELALLATRGIDALDGYFSLYLPQLVLAVIVPLTVIAVMLDRDWISAAITAVTVPLIPLFLVLVGAATRDRIEQQLRTLQQLAGHFLDVVAGLPTLKVFGRAKAQAQAIHEITDRYRRASLGTLRVTFLSSLVLELASTIAVALVAVAVGLRLMGGHLGLRTALLVLVLAPEAYVPLRRLGANYHASAEGMAAAERVFDVLDMPVPARGRRTAIPDPALTGLAVEDLCVAYPGRERPALDGVSLWLAPGEVLALTGPSGSGKSTLLAVLLGFVTPQRGSVSIGGTDLADLDLDAWRAKLSWVPQRPHLFAASLRENIRLGRPWASEDDVRHAVAAAGLADVVARCPAGLETMLGERGAGLSAGERQRVALARAFLRDSPLILLDEPTANLDADTEAQVLDAAGRLIRGRTALVVAHRPALIDLADRVVSLDRVAVAA